MSLSATEAARATGMSKAAILKAIKTGRMSASKDADGQWQVDPAELFRVYDPVHTEVSASTPHSQRDDASVEARLLREQLADRDETIRDLRARLDAADDERRRLSLQLTDASRPWWKRVLGG